MDLKTVRYNVQTTDFMRSFDIKNMDNNSDDLWFIMQRQRAKYLNVASVQYMRDLPIILDTQTGEILDIF